MSAALSNGMYCSTVLLWPYEWDVLSANFPYDHIITINRTAEDSTENGASSSPADLTSYTTNPGE